MIIRLFALVLLLSVLFWYVSNRFFNKPVLFVKVFFFTLSAALLMGGFLLLLSQLVEGLN